MSLAIKYETAEDARMRLKSTIVLYKDEPVLISDIKAGGGKDDILRVLFIPLPYGAAARADGLGAKIKQAHDAIDPNGAEERKYISSKHFDIAPFKMGYVNRKTGSGAYYTSRMPNRIQKQGLCRENFKGVDNYGNPVDFNTFYSDPAMIAMVKDDYPAFDRAVALLDKSKSVAFSRDFALVRDEVIPALIYLYHKGAKVGMFNKNEVTLGDKFKCLKESLSEMRLKVAA